MKETKDRWRDSKHLKKVTLFEDPIFENVGISSITLTFFFNRKAVDETELEVVSNGLSIFSNLDFDSERFYLTEEDEEINDLVLKVRPTSEALSMSSIVGAKSFFGIDGGSHFKNTPSGQASIHKIDSLDCKVLVNENVNGLGRNLYFYINSDHKYWSTRNVDSLKANWKIAFPASGDRQSERNYLLQPGEVHTNKYLSVLFATESDAINFQKYLSTRFYQTLVNSLLVDQNALRKVHRNVPLLDFTTGEILDKPGTFLDFTKPETLDDQLAEIYELSEEERALMTKDLDSMKG